MGCSTFAEYTVMPEIALAKVNPEAPPEHACLFACGLSTGPRRRDEHRQGCARLDLRRLRRGHGRPRRGRGLPAAGGRADRVRRPLPGRLELAKGQGATDTLVGGPGAVEEILELTDGFGADYTFEATGNVKVMRQAVESARMGWGLCTVAGVAGKGEVLEIIPRFLITGRRVAGSSFGGVKGRDQVPELVERALAGEIDVEAFVSHRIRLDDVNPAFELMEAQDGIRSVIEL